MGKDLQGNELGRGIRQRKNGLYEARSRINGIEINLCRADLEELISEFKEKTQTIQTPLKIKYANATLDEWYGYWFDFYKKPYLKQSSIYPTMQRYKTTFQPLLGKHKISMLTVDQIQRATLKICEGTLSRKTISDALGRLCECLNAAKIHGIISENPCELIIVPTQSVHESKERRYLSIEEQNLFLNQVKNDWYEELFYMMFLTGMRVGEIGALCWQDIDFKKKQIHVKRSLNCQYVNGVKTQVITYPKTPNSIRVIPFFGEAEDMLIRQKTKIESLRQQLGDRFRAKEEAYQDLVFFSSMGSVATRYVIEHKINHVVDAINYAENVQAVMENRAPKKFEAMYPHAIRHTFACRCFECKMVPLFVMKIMGHANYSTTMSIYTHVTGQVYDEETRKLLKANTSIQIDPEKDAGEKEMIESFSLTPDHGILGDSSLSVGADGYAREPAFVRH